MEQGRGGKSSSQFKEISGIKVVSTSRVGGTGRAWADELHCERLHIKTIACFQLSKFGHLASRCREQCRCAYYEAIMNMANVGRERYQGVASVERLTALPTWDVKY